MDITGNAPGQDAKNEDFRFRRFFAKSNLPLGDIVSTIYFWAVGMSMTTTPRPPFMYRIVNSLFADS